MKNIYIILLLLCSAVLYSEPGFSDTDQYEFGIDTVQFPPGIDWKKIETENFKIIYPAELRNDAERILNMLEYENNVLEGILDTEMSKWTIVLNNTYALPNGYVASAPEKSEFYSVPPQGAFAGTTEWYKLLTSHETYHMAQIDKLNSGFNKLIGIFTGEGGRSVFIHLSVPGWYFEGDAVLTETLLTEGGRGRLPDFEKEIKSILLSNKKYSYYSALNNSYGDYYPNHYNHGYLLVTYIKMKYGTEAMNEILKRTAKLSFIPLRFNSSVKKVTGKRVAEIHEEAMEYYKSEWEKQEAERGFSVYSYITGADKGFNSYEPLGCDGDDIIAVKLSLDNITTIYRISPDGSEEKISEVPYSSSAYSYKNKSFVWSEAVSDIRWGNRIYSDIFTADSDFRNRRKLTSKGYYYSPDLSPDGKKIAAVEVAPDRKHIIRIISAEKGQLISSLENSENYVITFPRFTEDGKSVVYTASGSRGIAVFKADAVTGEKILLKDFSWINIKYPYLRDNTLYYVSPENGIDAVYTLDTDTMSERRITDSRFASGRYLIKEDSSVIFADYTSGGWKIAVTGLNNAGQNSSENFFSGTDRIEKPGSDENIKTPSFFRNVDMKGLLPGGNEPLLAEKNIPQKKYNESEYSRGLNLLNFHSWGLIYDSEDDSMGINLKSNDIFNDLSLSLSGSYSFEEENYNFQTLLEYGGFFPLIKAGYRLKNTTVTTELSDDTEYEESWRENTAILGLQIPFNFSSSFYERHLSFSATAEFTDYSDWKSESSTGVNRNGFEIPVIYSVYYSVLKDMALQDLYPELGIQLRQSYIDSATSDIYSLVKSDASVYVPGLFENHGLKFNGSWYKNLNDSSVFPPSDIAVSRGYDLKLYNSAFYGSADYVLPLFYPDIPFSSFAYLSRIYLNLFNDITFETGERDSDYLYSVGCGFNFELSWMSTPVRSVIKIRTLYNFDEDKYKTTVLAVF